MTAKKQVLFAGVALALAAHGGVASAQSNRGALESASEGDSNFRRDRNVAVMQRPHPGYEAMGVREGAFMIWPKLTSTLEYNNNIFATNSDTVSDGIWHVTPELNATSNWSRHSLQAYARGTLNRYWSATDQNTDDYSVGMRGRLDVLRAAEIDAGVDHSRLTEPRTSAGSEGQAFPVQYALTSAYLGGAQEFNRLRLSGRVDWKKFDYENQEGNFPQDDRNRTQIIGTVRADYAVSPDTALFLQVAANKRDYKLERSPIVGGVPEFPNFVNRDSDGVEVLAGANFELAALVRGEIGLGYLTQEFDDSAFDDVSGLGARAQVEWFPTQLTTVTLTGARTVEDAAISRSSSYLSNNVSLQVDHELLRNLILSANAGYGKDDYRGIDRTDERYNAGVSATYILNRAVGLNLAYNHMNQDSSGADSTLDVANYTVDRIALTLTLQY